MPTGPFRGGVVVNDSTLYGAWTGELWSVNQSGIMTKFDDLDGTDLVTFAQNAKTQPDVVVVTDTGPFVINISGGSVDAYPDGDVNSPTCCFGYLGFLFFGYGDGSMRVSSYNSTSINSLNQANTTTNADGIKSIFGYNGQIYACGDKTIEVWGEPINATGFPLSRVGFNITPGLIGAHAVAGWEPEFGYPPIWVGSDGTVRQLGGSYQPVKISNTDLDRDIRAVSFNDLSGLTTLVYNVGGHAFWQVNLPTKSWVYHVNEGTWHQRRSQYLPKSRLYKSVHFAERWAVGDYEDDTLYAMDLSSETEGGSELTACMESGPVEQFPHRQRCVRADFNFTPGVGLSTGTDPIQTDPQALLEVSWDGGRTWPHSWNRKLGAQAETDRNIYILNPGMSGSRGPRLRWSISDPVHVGFRGADLAHYKVSK